MSKLKSIFADHKDLDQKSIGFLIKALEANNVEGFDYLEFKMSLAQLKNIQLEEDLAVKSAFATATTMGLTKDKLIQSGGFYQKVLAKEKEKFDQAHQNQVARQVKSKTEKVAQLEEKIDELKAKIGELEEKVRSYKEVIEKAKSDIQGSQSKIAERKSRFEEAYKALNAEIARDITMFDEKL